MSVRCVELGDQRPQCLADVAGEPEVDRGPATEVQRLVVDLDDRLSGREERVVGEVGAEHEQQVAVGEGLGRTAPAEQAGHPDGGRVVGLEHVLAAVGVRHRGVQGAREPEHLLARVAGALAAVDGDLLGPRDELDRLVEGGLGRPHHRTVGEDRVRKHRVVDRLGGHVAGQDDHPDPALEDRGLQGELGDPGHLRGRRHQADVVGAPGEDRIRVGLLEVAAADLGAGDVRRDREDRRAVALAVVEPVQQVQAARAGRAEHRGRAARDLGVRAGGEGARLLVADVHELDVALVPPQGVDDRVGRVADDPVDLPDPGLDHLVDKDLRHRLSHALLLV